MVSAPFHPWINPAVVSKANILVAEEVAPADEGILNWPVVIALKSKMLVAAAFNCVVPLVVQPETPPSAVELFH